MKQRQGLKLVDILVTVVVAVVFGIVYKLWTPLYYAVKPFGLRLDELIYGMWFIAAPVAYLIIRKPGVALLAETAAASAELMTGSEWGVTVLISGVVQGLATELVLALFRYNRYDLSVLSLAAAVTAVASLGVDYFNNYIEDLAVWNLTAMIVARVIGSVVIAGGLAYYLVKALEATGVTQLVRPASASDYEALKK